MDRVDKLTTERLSNFQQGRDREANFAALRAWYDPLVRRFFQRKQLSAEDGQDLTQEVFISVYKGLDGLREVEKFKYWLFRIARNAHLTYIKKHARELQVGSLEANAGGGEKRPPVGWRPVDPKPNPEEELLDKEKLDAVRRILSALPEQQRNCLHLRAEGSSYKEIAARMQIGAETVRSHIHQARATLRAKLGPEFFEDWNDEER